MANLFRKLTSQRVLAAVLLTIFSAFTISSPALALSAEQRKTHDKDVHWLDRKEEGSCGSGSEAGACAGLVGASPEEQAYNFFVGKGLSPMISSAIVGNLMHESGLNTNAVNSKSGAYGIAQWLGGRRDNLEAGPTQGLKGYAKDHNQPIDSYCLQLDFLWWEATESAEAERDVLGKMKAIEQRQEGGGGLRTLDRLTFEWEDVFERSGGAGIAERQQNARDVFADFGDGASGTPTTGSTTGSSGCATAGMGGVASIVQKALELAWPQPFRDANPPQPGRNGPTYPTDAYERAVAQFNRGNTGLRSIDCGVFVSTVMRASGADPDYPPVGTSVQYTYLVNHPELYQIIRNPTQADLQPGDILIITREQRGSSFGHTWIYVGPQAGGYTSASASLNSRAPNLGHEDLEGFTLARRIQ